MARRLGMATRPELIEAVGERYRRSGRAEKCEILDELVRVTGPRSQAPAKDGFQVETKGAFTRLAVSKGARPSRLTRARQN
jgi:hypothetical protein